MPVYNAEPYLAEAISSILRQTYSRFEFIIVDDGSTDDSSAIVRAFAARDARIRQITLPHVGQPRAKNEGIAAATGALIARMDADDIALPQRLAVQLEAMRRSDVDICGSCVMRFGTQNGPIWFPETHDAIRTELLFRVAVLDPTVLMRAQVAKANLFAENVSFTSYELWTRLAMQYRMGNTQQILLKHRCHSQQVHVTESEGFREDLCKYREPYFYNLFPNASPQDYTAIARVADKKPFCSLSELERAGKWLVSLAQTPDGFLRQRMAERWLAACKRSAWLGFDCYRRYRQFAPAFGPSPRRDHFDLWVACALRLKSGSKPYAALARLKRPNLPFGAGPAFSHHPSRQSPQKGTQREAILVSSSARQNS